MLRHIGSMALVTRGGTHTGLLAMALQGAIAAWVCAGQAWAAGDGLATVPAQAIAGDTVFVFDGVVEAVRQSVVASQVPGAVVRLDVKAGDRVTAGQALLRIDARAPEQDARASDAQLRAARAQLDAAGKDFERQKQLFQKKYISQAALERSESDFKAAGAQVDAHQAQSGAARAHSSLHVVRAPFTGLVAEVPVSLGDMAMPGRPLLTVYDPSAMRVTVAVPQTISAQAAGGPTPRIELPGLAQTNRWVAPAHVSWLPTVDPGTHTVQLRAELPAGLPGVVPGLFARLWLPMPQAAAGHQGAAAVSVSSGAIVRRAEMTGLYVLDPGGKPVLRQVRLGRTDGDRVEVLSGVMPGERVVSDPQAAARVAPGVR
jgi:RND family efflux transporter MFP subunit